MVTHKDDKPDAAGASAPAAAVPLHKIDKTAQYEAFMARLRAYHAARGTVLDPEPKLGAIYLDLFKVFNHIVANGGYDKVSDEKLAWRRMAAELGIVSSNEASTAFALKEKFYKNLAAFEIKTVHGKEPPPKDILEDVTAKGAALLTRTRENFRGAKRDSTIGVAAAAASGGVADSQAGSGDEAGPGRDRPTSDTPAGTSTRASRGLREAPPQRIIFQPDTGPSRPPRQSSGHHHGPSHQASHHHHAHTSAASNSNSGSNSNAASAANLSAASHHAATPAASGMSTPQARNIQHQPNQLPAAANPGAAATGGSFATPGSASFASASGSAGLNARASAAANSGHLSQLQPSQLAQQLLQPASQPAAPRFPGRVSVSVNNNHAVHQSTLVQLYEGKPSNAVPFQPVNTPVSNPVEFAKRRLPPRQPHDPARTALSKYMEGPNIYVRCLMALKSKLPAELSYALFHLVRISYERGDRFKFESFAGLAEALVEQVLRVSSLFYHVEWDITWLTVPTSARADLAILNGNVITHDILERIKCLDPRPVTANLLETPAFVQAIGFVNEAALTLRNMMTLPDNALFMAGFPLLRDLICIVLALPAVESVAEVKNYALDMAEQLTPNITVDTPQDPLYRTLLAQLDSNDRAVLLAALRALARISMNLDATNELPDVPAIVLVRITEWILLNDDELLDACLDFLYQYTAVVRNVDHLIRALVFPENLACHLARLLSHGAKKTQRELVVVPERRLPARGDEVCPMPDHLLQELLKADEPGRVNQWVRCLFEEDEESFVTQLAVWQSYQSTFAPALKATGRPQITPAEFIRASVQVYKGPEAQVVRDAEQQKFIIRGIRARERPVSITGREYQQCLWVVGAGVGAGAGAGPNAPDKPAICGQWFLHPQAVWEHIVEAHLGQVRGPSGNYPGLEWDERSHECRWAGCDRWAAAAEAGQAMPRTARVVANHAVIHTWAMWPAGHGTATHGNITHKAWLRPAQTVTIHSEETTTVRDEKNPTAPPQAAGIPLSAALVLRNMARNVGKTEAEEELRKANEQNGKLGGWNERMFRLLVPRLHEVFSDNKALGPYMLSILDLVYQDPELEAALMDRAPQDDA